MATTSSESGQSSSSGEQQEERLLNRLRALRGGNRAAATKLIAELAKIIQDQPGSFREPNILARLDSIAQSMKLKQEYLTELNQKILEVCDLAEIDKEIDESTEYDTSLLESLGKISLYKQGNYVEFPGNGNSGDSVGQATTNLVSTPPRNLSVGSSSNGVQGPPSFGTPPSHNSQGFEHNPGTAIKLPKISLPRFNGDIKRFPTFWQSFGCAVNRNASISAVQKISYLLSLLDGAAYRALEGLDLTEQNYEHGLQILKSRFGKKQQIINEHMSALLKL